MTFNVSRRTIPIQLHEVSLAWNNGLQAARLAAASACVGKDKVVYYRDDDDRVREDGQDRIGLN